MPLTLSSPCFSHGGVMPRRCTGDGPDTSPPLTWSGAPEGTRSFALIVEDPDAPDPAAPRRVWVHWLVCDLPPSTTSLAEGASGKAMPAGSKEGKNDSGGNGYEGPYPPIGSHRYFFKLYALDTLTGVREGHTKPQLVKAMEGHVLASAELMGTYARERKA